jgi:hypothetical protein
MLNTKYIIVQDPQSGNESVIANPDAYGPAWLVKHVKVVDGRVAALQSIGQVNLRDTAILEQSHAKGLVQPAADSLSRLRMTSYAPDRIEYEITANGPQFAVFSEIYYPKGWNAYIDDKPVTHVNVNYLLRGLSIPPGDHKIRFVFEPRSYTSGTRIMYITSFIIVLVVLGGFYLAWRQGRKTA